MEATKTRVTEEKLENCWRERTAQRGHDHVIYIEPHRCSPSRTALPQCARGFTARPRNGTPRARWSRSLLHGEQGKAHPSARHSPSPLGGPHLSTSVRGLTCKNGHVHTEGQSQRATGQKNTGDRTKGRQEERRETRGRKRTGEEEIQIDRKTETSCAGDTRRLGCDFSDAVAAHGRSQLRFRRDDQRRYSGGSFLEHIGHHFHKRHRFIILDKIIEAVACHRRRNNLSRLVDMAV